MPTTIKELPPNLERILSDFFQRKQKPNKEERINLAAQVGLDLTEITGWFSNKRCEENKKRGKGNSSGTANEKVECSQTFAMRMFARRNIMLRCKTPTKTSMGDIRNKQDLEKLFSQAKFDAVIHFAGLKAVGESMAHPFRYFDNNLIGSITLYQVMAKYNCKKLVFSSSATVYGQPKKIPCVEDFELKAMNPYGRTKLYLEEIARDIHTADPEWKIILLRYFNPVGAHESGRLGEDPIGIPNNLMPYIQQVAVGRLPELNVYGHDYPTNDGTAVRDYIHVMDLADGHVAALKKLFTKEDIGCFACNLGTGKGTSVLEMVTAFEKASGKKIPVKFCPRRPGDATEVYASTDKAASELGWKAKYGIDEMCRDQWNWARQNPWGYQKPPTK